MDTAYLRRCLNLHWSKSYSVGLLWVVLFLAAVPAQAQTYQYKRKFLEHYDDKLIHFGFFFAMPSTRFNIKHSDAFVPADSAFRITSPNRSGFQVGFIMNAFMNDRFDFRTTPSVSLYGREVTYDYPGGTSITETRESTWLDVPLLLKYKSERRRNTRMYLLAGASFGIETNVRKNEVGTSRLSTATTDMSLQYGVGLEQFFQYFKFAPELRFSHGLPNIFRPTNNAAGLGISRLTTHTVTLYLNFE